jgi:hypothetical protein
MDTKEPTTEEMIAYIESKGWYENWPNSWLKKGVFYRNPDWCVRSAKYAYDLEKRKEKTVMAYIDAFCEKQDLHFDSWVGNDIGGLADFNDLCFNFQDIVWDINSSQKKGLIIEWISESIDNPGKSINYYSYTLGLRFSDIN